MSAFEEAVVAHGCGRELSRAECAYDNHARG
jgi:hypothetical protein